MNGAETKKSTVVAFFRCMWYIGSLKHADPLQRIEHSVARLEEEGERNRRRYGPHKRVEKRGRRVECAMLPKLEKSENITLASYEVCSRENVFIKRKEDPDIPTRTGN